MSRIGLALIGASLVSAYFLVDLALFVSPLLLAGEGSSCLLDNEASKSGSWSIGLFRGPSPLNLTPVGEQQAGGRQRGSGGNPILTCADVSGPPSNFVADPFLHIGRRGALHLFFETKTNTGGGQGDIGVAESHDSGASWRYLGLALDEPWHLSYPFVFAWRNATYMLPEGYGSGSLRLYKAERFPLRRGSDPPLRRPRPRAGWEPSGEGRLLVVASRAGWQLEKVLLPKLLIDTSLVEWGGWWWMFTSDVVRRRMVAQEGSRAGSSAMPPEERRGATKNGELEIYYADSPLGPWQAHAGNPVMNGDPSAGARMGGRPVVHGGRLYRFGQDCGQTYGHRRGRAGAGRGGARALVAWEVLELSPTAFRQRRVGLRHGAQAGWNAARYHHLDAHRMADGSYLAVMDGDSVPSGPISGRVIRTASLLGVLWAAALAAAVVFHVRERRSAGNSSSPYQAVPPGRQMQLAGWRPTRSPDSDR
eukprot:scaffold16.g43.t1